MLKKIRKILFIGTLSTLGVCILMLMATLIVKWVADKSLFKNQVFLRILVSSAILCADCFFNNSALSVIKKTKVLSLISVALLNLATLLSLILFIGTKDLTNAATWYVKTIGVVAITATFFTILISTDGKLGNHLKPIKIIYYSLMIIIDLVIIGCILGEKLNLFKLVDWFVFPFVLMCIAAFALMCVTSIMGRHYKDEAVEDALDTNEVDSLKKEIERLTKENAELKAQIEELKKNEDK